METGGGAPPALFLNLLRGLGPSLGSQSTSSLPIVPEVSQTPTPVSQPSQPQSIIEDRLQIEPNQPNDDDEDTQPMEEVRFP